MSDKPSSYVRRFLDMSNMLATQYMSTIVIALETWMLLSLTRSYVEGAAIGKHRDLMWFLQHGIWYIVLLAMGIVAFVVSRKYVKGKITDLRPARVLVWVFSLVCLAFGIHYGSNSYFAGEQILAFVTMTLFVFGILVWPPIPAFLLSGVTFGGFYIYISQAGAPSYGTFVNMLTLWISTFVVALSAYNQKVSEAQKTEELERKTEELEGKTEELEGKTEELEDKTAELQIKNDRLDHLAAYDELMGIPNIRTFRSAVRVLLEGIDELDTRYTIAYLDIENFKIYNEKYGFQKGDHLLQGMAHGLQEIFVNAFVARLSDDHFVALCMSDELDDHLRQATELLRGLRGDVRLRLKVGTYEPKTENENVELAIDKARIACNSVKKKADQFICPYDSKMNEKIQLRHHVINHIRTAVNDGWIKVFYQPVVRCADGTAELCGYEALARWNDPEYGLLPPYAFIETLEEHREIDKLDRCIIEQVCRDLRAELDAGRPVVPVSLNFSRLDFELYDVPAYLEEMTSTYDLPSNLLDVEITESALTGKQDELHRYMDTLRGKNFSLWLDDFGSGYSSLNVLKDFEFDVLKIDMVFLRGFETNPLSRDIITSIVQLAKQLNMITLCEGVETLEQFEFLRSIGCDRAQGYYFGKPDAQKAEPRKLGS